MTDTTARNLIQRLAAELDRTRQVLHDFQSELEEGLTVATAVPGDVLQDGSIVIKNIDGLALLVVAPAWTQVMCKWSETFPEAYDKLREEGFNPSQWFIPAKEQLALAYSVIPSRFDAGSYWSSTEVSSTNACAQGFLNGIFFSSFKTNSHRVRAFRCVTY